MSKNQHATSIVKLWTAEKLSFNLGETLDRIATSEDVIRVAVMPDIHEGSAVPNGCVFATRTLIYPEGVGRDIGCGISAIQISLAADKLRPSILQQMLEYLARVVPALKHPRPQAVAHLPEACSSDGLSNSSLGKVSRREGILQLGTLGRGNHFVELQRDNEGGLWAMVHSGSRGMGEAITSYYLSRAQRAQHSGLAFLDLGEKTGQDYLNDMQWALRYATESRLLILNRVVDFLERTIQAEVLAESYIDCPHNFARLETHFGRDVVVHRKSANSARAGELGIIPASMADGSRIVSGRGNPEALNSSSHGAGRAKSRRAAAESIPGKTLAAMMQGIAFQAQRTEQLRDEAPGAYKNLKDVMRAQADLVRTEKLLSTLLNYKGF